MFSAMVALNRNVSCGTKPICRRSSAGSSLRRSMPSSSTAPPVGSNSRGSRFTSVLLPEPVWPTTASVVPAGMRRSIPLSARTAAVIHRHVAELDLAAHLAQAAPASGGAAIDGCSRRISLMRCSDALPRCIRLTTQPSAIMGHTSMPM